MIATMKSQKIDHYRQALKEGRITQQEYDPSLTRSSASMRSAAFPSPVLALPASAEDLTRDGRPHIEGAYRASAQRTAPEGAATPTRA